MTALLRARMTRALLLVASLLLGCGCLESEDCEDHCMDDFEQCTQESHPENYCRYMMGSCMNTCSIQDAWDEQSSDSARDLETTEELR